MFITQLIVVGLMLVALHYLALYLANNGMTYRVWLAVAIILTFIIIFGLDIWTGNIPPQSQLEYTGSQQ